jgi:hypothetical protein
MSAKIGLLTIDALVNVLAMPALGARDSFRDRSRGQHKPGSTSDWSDSGSAPSAKIVFSNGRLDNLALTPENWSKNYVGPQQAEDQCGRVDARTTRSSRLPEWDAGAKIAHRVRRLGVTEPREWFGAFSGAKHTPTYTTFSSRGRRGSVSLHLNSVTRNCFVAFCCARRRGTFDLKRLGR